MLSPYDYWQFWRNTEDADVGRFLKLFTILPLTEIARLAALGGSEINEAKKVLGGATPGRSRKGAKPPKPFKKGGPRAPPPSKRHPQKGGPGQAGNSGRRHQGQ